MEVTTDFAIEYLLDDCDDCPENKDGECMTQSNCFKVKQMAIKALEQETCEDAISRQAVLDLVNSDWKYEGLETAVASLPPVTPQPKTGHWIEEIDDYGKVIGWHCDKCYEDSGFATDCKWDFCPICGAKMEVEE